MSYTSFGPFSQIDGPAEFSWPAGFERIPDAPWATAPVGEFGLGNDSVGNHG